MSKPARTPGGSGRPTEGRAQSQDAVLGVEVDLTRPVVEAAGALLWRGDDPGSAEPAADVEIAVVHRPHYDDWSLPKGKRDGDEAAASTAVREVAEETGMTGPLGPGLGEVRYPVAGPDGQPVPKRVRWFAQRAVTGVFVPSEEVDALRWLSPDAALAVLSRAADREVVARFLAVGPTDGAVALVRHARAGSRHRWHGPDGQRPLDPAGVRQARALAPTLAAYQPDRVESATPLRCQQTVAPLAAALGIETQTSRHWDDERYERDSTGARRQLRSLLSRPGTAVACSQGVTITELLRGLTLGPVIRDADGLGHAQGLKAQKGSVWLLHTRRGRVVDAEYLSPPAHLAAPRREP